MHDMFLVITRQLGHQQHSKEEGSSSNSCKTHSRVSCLVGPIKGRFAGPCTWRCMLGCKSSVAKERKGIARSKEHHHTKNPKKSDFGGADDGRFDANQGKWQKEMDVMCRAIQVTERVRRHKRRPHNMAENIRLISSKLERLGRRRLSLGPEGERYCKVGERQRSRLWPCFARPFHFVFDKWLW